jgi:hypothetical protein
LICPEREKHSHFKGPPKNEKCLLQCEYQLKQNFEGKINWLGPKKELEEELII